MICAESLYLASKKYGDAAIGVARSLGIIQNTVRTIVRRARESGRIERLSVRNRPQRKVTLEIERFIEQLVEVVPSITLRQIADECNSRFGIVLGTSTIDRVLQRLRVTLKRASIVLDRVNDQERLILRHRYASNFLHNFQVDRKRIFIDECSFNLHLRRGYGRSTMGSRVTLSVPTVRGRNCTLLAAINTEGVVYHKIFYGACTGEIFSVFLEELDEKLKYQYEIHDGILYMDNARPHIANIVKEAHERISNSVVFLSSYSYMLNPIEFAFSKIKNIVRQNLNGNNVELPGVIVEALGEISMNDCEGWYRLIRRNCVLALEYHRFE
jgi:transposase